MSWWMAPYLFIVALALILAIWLIVRSRLRVRKAVHFNRGARAKAVQIDQALADGPIVIPREIHDLILSLPDPEDDDCL